MADACDICGEGPVHCLTRVPIATDGGGELVLTDDAGSLRCCKPCHLDFCENDCDPVRFSGAVHAAEVGHG